MSKIYKQFLAGKSIDDIGRKYQKHSNKVEAELRQAILTEVSKLDSKAITHEIIKYKARLVLIKDKAKTLSSCVNFYADPGNIFQADREVSFDNKYNEPFGTLARKTAKSFI